MCGPKKIRRLKVLMEHPPKQGLKPNVSSMFVNCYSLVLMEHPPKQGLKLIRARMSIAEAFRF